MVCNLKKLSLGTFPVVRQIKLCASTAGGASSIPGWGAKIPHVVLRGKKKKIITHFHPDPRHIISQGACFWAFLVLTSI